MITIGSAYIPPASRHEQRGVDGAYAQTMPDITADGELLQRALLAIDEPPSHAGDRLVAAVTYIGLACLLVVGLIEKFAS